MRPAIATVVGPSWEAELVAHARLTGLARLVGRCCDLASLGSIASRADAVYVGSDAAWLPDADLRRIATRTRLIGVATDLPGAALLDRAGVSEIVDVALPASGLLSIALEELAADKSRLIEVTGPRGAPGRSEVALALAFETHGCLVEADRDGPSLGLRMGLLPDRARTAHDIGDLALSPQPVSPGEGYLTGNDLDSLRRIRLTTVLDAGPDSTWHRTATIDQSVIVGEATDIGVIRLARLCERWMGAMPALIVNRHRNDQDLRQVIRATGLEPVAVIPEVPSPRPGEPPHPQMRAAIRVLSGQRTAR